MKYKLIGILVIIQILVFGQETYVKVIDENENRTGYQITRYEGRIFMSVAGVYNNSLEGALIMEVDENSDVLWKKNLQWIDISSGSMIIKDDVISLSGNHNPEQIEFYLHKMSIDGGDSITTHIIDDDSVDLDRMFQLSTIHYNGKFLIGGTANVVNSNLNNSIIYVVDDTSGEVDTLLILDQQTNSSAIWELIEDSDGNLLAIVAQRMQFGNRFRSIIKLDPEFNVIWKYTSEEDFFNRSKPKGCELEDGKIAMVMGSIGGEIQIHSIRAINKDSTIAWQFHWPDINSFQREILNIELTSDGSILVTGMYGWLSQTVPIGDVPFIAKISTEGDLIWERGFIQFDGQGEMKRGLLFDVEELDDASLLVLGQQSNDNGDILIMKLNAEGCLEDDCGLHNMFTDVNDLVIGQSEVNVYPNPAQDDLYIDTEIEFQMIKVYDAKGNLVYVEKYNSVIQLNQLRKGIYFLKLVTTEGKGVLKRLMKL